MSDVVWTCVGERVLLDSESAISLHFRVCQMVWRRDGLVFSEDYSERRDVVWMLDRAG